MKICVAVAVTFFVASCEATFFGKGGGNVALSGNIHGSAGHPWLGQHGAKATEAPVVITEAPIIVPESAPAASGHGFSLQGQLQGLLKNHKLLSGLHGNRQPAAAAPEPVAYEPVQEVAPSTPSKGFSLHGNLQGLLKNHKWFSGGSNNGFSLQGNLQGLLKNHRLLAGHFNKNTATQTTEDPFGGDNTGFSVSTGESGFQEVDPGASVVSTGESDGFTAENGNVDLGISETSSGQSETNAFSEIPAVPEPSPISADVPNQSSGSSGSSLSGHFSASANGGHNFQKILGSVVDAKVKFLEQAKNQVSSRFDNHIRNLDKLKNHFNKNQASAAGSSASSIDGQFLLNAERRRY